MRRLTGALLLAGCAIPALALTANSGAGATTPGTSCSKAAGTITFQPPIPVKGPVTVKIIIKGTLSGCKGGGVTSGAVNGTEKFPVKVDCQVLLAGKAGNPSGTQTVKWNTTKTSTIAVHGVTSTSQLDPHTQGKVTAGLFLGKKMDQTVHVDKINPSSGACSTAALKSLHYIQKTAFKLS